MSSPKPVSHITIQKNSQIILRIRITSLRNATAEVITLPLWLVGILMMQIARFALD